MEKKGTVKMKKRLIALKKEEQGILKIDHFKS